MENSGSTPERSLNYLLDFNKRFEMKSKQEPGLGNQIALVIGNDNTPETVLFYDLLGPHNTNTYRIARANIGMVNKIMPKIELAIEYFESPDANRLKMATKIKNELEDQPPKGDAVLGDYMSRLVGLGNLIRDLSSQSRS